MSKAYCTLLGNNEYFFGTLSLIASLDKVESMYPMVVMVTDNIDENYIKYLKQLKNVIVKKVNPINVSDDVLSINNQNGQPKWTHSFTKLNMFNLTEYEKLVFVDSDMLIIDNIDNLFDLPNLSATIADKAYPRKEAWKELNSGIMVIEPKTAEFNRLKNLIPKDTKSPIGDQDILHLGYPNWKTNNNLHLDESYNVFFNHIDFYKQWFKNGNSEKVIHFIGPNKPWNMSKSKIVIYYLQNISKRHFIEINYFNKYRSLLKTEIKKYNNWSITNDGL